MKTSLIAFLLLVSVSMPVAAQNYRPNPNDTLQSPTIASDGRVTFRIFAPHSDTVILGGGDMPVPPASRMLTKAPNGVWEVTVPPVAPGAYRYNFIVDGVTVADPRNPSVSESNTNAWSLVYIPGADFMDTKEVPHGAVAEVTYYSTSLQRFRRMHVYTPPGYETSSNKYPVFFLLHGAFDCDDAWTTVGRAGFILDNLIAAKKATPMVVVMPAGHTGPFTAAALSRFSSRSARDEFVEDFVNDIKPFVEKRYRVRTDRSSRAIAGLSMGGAQTLNIAIPNLSDYAYIGVFSSGLFELGGRPGGTQQGPTWEERNRAMLENAKLNRGLGLLWFATGKDDFLLGVSQKTVDLFRKYKFDVVYEETAGGHTWQNWREYLAAFAPLLFK